MQLLVFLKKRKINNAWLLITAAETQQRDFRFTVVWILLQQLLLSALIQLVLQDCLKFELDTNWNRVSSKDGCVRFTVLSVFSVFKKL